MEIKKNDESLIKELSKEDYPLESSDAKAIEEQSENKQIVLMSKFSPVPFADELMSKNEFIFDKYGRFWRYYSQEGIWSEDAEEFIRNELRAGILMGIEQQRRAYVEEVVSYIRG